MSATRRMYSTIDAPRSVAVNLASSHVRNTNRFMVLAPSRLSPQIASTGPLWDSNPRTAPSTLLPCERRSGAGAAELATRVVELAVDLVLQEHDGGDDGQGDQ